MSVERETFPALLREGATVLGVVDDGYWLDLGTPLAFVRGSCDLVTGRAPSPAVPGPTGEYLVLPGAEVSPEAHAVRRARAVGAGATVGSGAVVEGSVLFDSAVVAADAIVRNRAVGEGAIVGPGARPRRCRRRGPCDHRGRQRAGRGGQGVAGGRPRATPPCASPPTADVGAPASRRWRPGRPVPLRAIWGPLQRGGGDPATRLDPGTGAWRAFRASTGPVTLRVRLDPAPGDVVAEAWGPGAEEALQLVPAMLGGDDVTAADFDGAAMAARAAHPAVASAWRRYGDGWRVPRCRPVLDQLVAAVLEQRVTGVESRRAWRWPLVARHGEPAPVGDVAAPAGLRVPPDAADWRRVPSWDWHRAGVDGGRSATVLRVAGAAGRVEECAGMAPAAAAARLRAIPGIGVWTAAETAQRALGDPDAVSFGDVHLAEDVVYAMTGRSGGDDDALAEVLEPWRGHRYRVVRMCELAGVQRPRQGSARHHHRPSVALTAHPP